MKQELGIVLRDVRPIALGGGVSPAPSHTTEHADRESGGSIGYGAPAKDQESPR